MSALLDALVQEFGTKARWCGVFGAKYLRPKIREEELRLAQGWTYEPPTFYEANDAFLASTPDGQPPQRARYVASRVSTTS